MLPCPRHPLPLLLTSLPLVLCDILCGILCVRVCVCVHAGSRGLTVDELLVAAGKEEGVSMVEIRAGKVLQKYAPVSTASTPPISTHQHAL